MRRPERRKPIRIGGDPSVRIPGSRPASRSPVPGHARAQPGPAICSQTVLSDRRLLDSLEQGTAAYLGHAASQEEVRALATRWYERRRRRQPPPETVVQRWDREEMEERARQDLRLRL